jgi:hypothetical protein
MLDLKQIGTDLNVLIAAIEQGAVEREDVERFFVRLVPGVDGLPAVKREQIDELVSRLDSPKAAA